MTTDPLSVDSALLLSDKRNTGDVKCKRFRSKHMKHSLYFKTMTFVITVLIKLQKKILNPSNCDIMMARVKLSYG